MPHTLRPYDPRSIGRYELVARLGQGGMGVVFLGHDDVRDRAVAVKVLRDEHSFDDEFRGRFRSEVSRIRQVPPFCTAEVLDADLDHAPPYLVVEYVDGPSLAEVVKQRGPLHDAQLHSVALGMATALTAIHGAGVVHRDLKPENVLLGLTGVKVIDFGIARPLEVTSQHTSTGQMIGTVAYMAPERLDGDAARAADPATDIFAWGAVVTYAATGRTPFAGDSPPATAVKILTQPPDIARVPEPLRAIVQRALAKDPVERPTARELLDLLLGERTGDVGAASRQPGVPEFVASQVAPMRAAHARPRKPRRRWVLAALGAAALTVLVLLGLTSLAASPADPDVGVYDNGAPLEAAEPVEDFSFGVRGWADGRLRVSDAQIVSTAYEMAVVRSQSNDIVGSLVVYRPGAFAPDKLTAAEATTVDGQDALEDLEVPAPGASRVTTKLLAWQYADDAWATLSTYPVEGEPSIEELRALTAGLEVGDPVPAKLPFSMEYLPAGYRPVEVGMHSWATENGLVTTDDGNYAGVVLARPAPKPAGLTEPWNPGDSGAVSDNIVLLVSPNKQDRRDGVVCKPSFCRLYDGEAFVDLVSDGRLSEAEMTKILKGILFAAVIDDTTWSNAAESFPDS